MYAWVRIPFLSNFAVEKPTFYSKQYFWEANWEPGEPDFTLPGVIENRVMQLQTMNSKGRMAERSKAPDSRNSPLRLLVHERVRGFESHSCKILRSQRGVGNWCENFRMIIGALPMRTNFDQFIVWFSSMSVMQHCRICTTGCDTRIANMSGSSCNQY